MEEEEEDHQQEPESEKTAVNFVIGESGEDSGQDSSSVSGGETDSTPSLESGQPVDSNVITVDQSEQASSNNSEGVVESKEDPGTTPNTEGNDSDDSGINAFEPPEHPG